MKSNFPLSRIAKIECTVVSVPSIRPCAWSRGVSHGTTRNHVAMPLKHPQRGLELLAAACLLIACTVSSGAESVSAPGRVRPR